jgi:hypothetical protein
MEILNIELTSIDKTDLGFEHWVDVTYQVPILKNKYTVKLLVLLDFKVEDKELLDYLVMSWKYRDLVLHSLQMYEMEKTIILLSLIEMMDSKILSIFSI